MKKQNAKILGLVFIAAAFVLGVVHLFFETKNDVPEMWIIYLIVIGLLLRLAPQKLIELIGRVAGRKTKNK